ncbi:MAG TPA: branched-chain amino acid ABC transporter substrate-binding protein [Acidimicrobiales bacterium]|nr:branched-chain amino acid ABC transporter substrate-binding protein [Acidimicrobiales bacterium]
MRNTRRMSLAFSLLAATGLLAAGCSSDDSEVSSGGSSSSAPAGGAGANCPKDVKIGFFGALTGSDAALGLNERNGVKVALDRYKKESGCEVKLEEYDSQGEPAQAPALASKAVTDKNVVAIIGPAFSGESKTANPIFNEGGLPIITPSATNAALSKNGWKIFHRAVANDDLQGPAAAKFILGKGAKKVAVIDDASEYGKGLADIVRTELREGGATTDVNEAIDPKGSDYSSTVNKVKAANVDAVFYGGYYESAGRLMKQLRDGNVAATFVAGDGSLDIKFLDSAGGKGEGAVLLAPGAYTASDQSFVDDYKRLNSGAEPGLYSVEGFDAANHVLAAIKAGKTVRADINAYISSTPYQGLLKNYQYQADGELQGGGDIIVHEVKSGKINLVGPVK